MNRGCIEPEASARAAGLRYISDALPGIARRPARAGFRYVDADGAAVRDRSTLARIRALAVPPAWTEVWICPQEDGHLQATGRDARRRKQYRYHERWREVRDESKYGRLVEFGRALPRIRRQVTRDLARAGMPREKVLATIVRLLETTFVRVGNEEYARQNESFGLTTLRERQVRVDGARLRFRFRGKSGVPHEIALTDRRIARIVSHLQELPGQELFQFVDDDGSTRAIQSDDVNGYLKSIAGGDFTSKDFRTWAATLLCARALRRLPPPPSPSAGKREVAAAIQAVARELRNTPAVCRKCYVHPAIVSCYLDGRLQEALRGRSERAGLITLLSGILARSRRPGTQVARAKGHARPRLFARHRRGFGRGSRHAPAQYA